ncbi:MAG: hypothetical protein KDA93_02480 [Planctomycetaceae bacterium]|nr:hypothetical protein [Planctomycetaceae bacterium]
MRQVSIPSVAIVLLVCGAVTSAGVVGTYAVVAPFVTGAAPENTSDVRLFVDNYLPVKVKKSVAGRLAPAGQGGISFVREGNLIQETPIGAGGIVQVSNLDFGPYSIFVNGPDGFAAIGTWIAPASDGYDVTGSGIEIALVPPVDMPLVEGIIYDHLQLGGGAAFGQNETRQPNTPQLADSPRNMDATSDVNHESVQAIDDGVAFQGTISRNLLQGHGFEIRPDGTIVGKIVRSTPPSTPEPPIPNLDVYFVQGGQVLAEGRTDYNGVFSVRGLHHGVYSMVIASADAFLAIAAKVHPPTGNVDVPAPVTGINFGGPNPKEESQTVALLTMQTTVAQASPVYGSDLGFLSNYFDSGSDYADGAPFGPGGGGGFGGGPGGGFGGGGGFLGGDGLGTLLGLGALGLGAAALADSNDNNNGVQVVSPAIP